MGPVAEGKLILGIGAEIAENTLAGVANGAGADQPAQAAGGAAAGAVEGSASEIGGRALEETAGKNAKSWWGALVSVAVKALTGGPPEVEPADAPASSTAPPPAPTKASSN
jgi:hypothetical protein